MEREVAREAAEKEYNAMLQRKKRLMMSDEERAAASKAGAARSVASKAKRKALAQPAE